MWLDRGLSVGDEAGEALPPLAEDALDGELTLGPDERQPRPAPVPVRAWWQAQRERLDPDRRLLAGHVLDLPLLARVLRRCPMRRRHPLALEIAARSTGRAQIHTRGLSLTQHEQTEDVFARLAVLDLQRGLPLAS